MDHAIKSTETAVIKTIENALELPPGSVDMKTSADNLAKWDSIGHISILVGLNNLYEGQISELPEFAQANSVEIILEILRKHKLL